MGYKLTKFFSSFTSDDVLSKTAQQLNHVWMRFQFLEQAQLGQEIPAI